MSTETQATIWSQRVDAIASELSVSTAEKTGILHGYLGFAAHELFKELEKGFTAGKPVHTGLASFLRLTGRSMMHNEQSRPIEASNHFGLIGDYVLGHLTVTDIPGPLAHYVQGQSEQLAEEVWYIRKLNGTPNDTNSDIWNDGAALRLTDRRLGYNHCRHGVEQFTYRLPLLAEAVQFELPYHPDPTRLRTTV